MFDSPIEFCPKCRHYVALDQTLEECARAGACQVALCPLEPLFCAPAAARSPQPAEAPGSSEVRAA